MALNIGVDKNSEMTCLCANLEMVMKQRDEFERLCKEAIALVHDYHRTLESAHKNDEDLDDVMAQVEGLKEERDKAYSLGFTDGFEDAILKCACKN